MTDAEDRLQDALAAAHTVGWVRRRTPGEALRELADTADDLGLGTADWDTYGARGAVARVEEELAAVLGAEAVVFLPSGTMAQQAVLRSWCDRSGSRRVALPDLSHLLLHESDGPRQLHGFAMEHLTTGAETATADHLHALPDPGGLGAVLVELPLREAGCLVPAWDDLVALSAAARELGVPLHADGARLWEAQVAWDRPLPEVVALLDSVYVSAYKGLAALSGAAVAVPEDLAPDVRRWRHRMGGTLYRMTPYALGMLAGLRRELPRMAELTAWARDLADHLVEAGLRVAPHPPHTSTFHVHADGDPATAAVAMTALVERTGVAPCHPWRRADAPGMVRTEVAVHPAALEHDPAVVAGWVVESLGTPG